MFTSVYLHSRSGVGVAAFDCIAYLYIYIAWLTSLFGNRPYTQAEVSLRDSHRVKQCNIKFHIGESVYCSGRGPQLTRLWLMAPAPSPNDCSPSLLAINKNIIYIFIFCLPRALCLEAFIRIHPSPFTTYTLTSAP